MSGLHPTLAEAIQAEEEGLLACVHCGFCLPACPTYVRLGDENDSPRGRLHLMRAVVEGRLDAGSDAFQTHIDRCLGCRACEPVCPSGVPYGRLLELARHEGAGARPPSALSRVLLRVFASRPWTDLFMVASRLLRATRLPALGARLLPAVPGLRRARLALGMLAATGRWTGLRGAGSVLEGSDAEAESSSREEGNEGTSEGLRLGVLRGCVQEGLFRRVNDATSRVLEANGYAVVPVPNQACCGAIHAHGGDLTAARDLARRNIAAFEGVDLDGVAVNAAGCGAQMKEYGHLLEGDSEWAERAARFSDGVADVSEWLARRGPRRGGPVHLRIAVDAPCHLLHAQGVETEPLDLIDAVPGAETVELEGAEECCGGAGVYGLLHVELGGRIGGDKVEAVLRSRADVVVTANPGCIMQIGAGLRMEGVDVPVFHPVELLDESYRRAGLYGG